MGWNPCCCWKLKDASITIGIWSAVSSIFLTNFTCSSFPFILLLLFFLLAYYCCFVIFNSPQSVDQQFPNSVLLLWGIRARGDDVQFDENFAPESRIHGVQFFLRRQWVIFLNFRQSKTLFFFQIMFSSMLHKTFRYIRWHRSPCTGGNGGSSPSASTSRWRNQIYSVNIGAHVWEHPRHAPPPLFKVCQTKNFTHLKNNLLKL